MKNNIYLSQKEREAVYKTIFSRRDVRKEFTADPVPEEVLRRIFTAAHHAPSVGFMQPWDFIVIKKQSIKQKIKDAFTAAHREAAQLFDDQKRGHYEALKLEGIMEALICIICDKTRNGPVVIGRTSIPEMDRYSTVCAIQNLWLAARSENLGMGWVSIIHNEALQEILNIPGHIVPIAYLCVGYVTHFHEKQN